MRVRSASSGHFRCPAFGVAAGTAAEEAMEGRPDPTHPFRDSREGFRPPLQAHIVAHKDGGGRETTDLFQGCHAHHVAYDAGWIRVEMVDGRPVFHLVVVDGARRPWPVPPHLRPNPLANQAERWTWSRPPPV